MGEFPAPEKKAPTKKKKKFFGLLEYYKKMKDREKKTQSIK